MLFLFVDCYSGSFSTDEVAVSLRYLREQRDPALYTAPNLQHLKDSPSQVSMRIDPGMRLFLGGGHMVGKQTEAENMFQSTSTIQQKFVQNVKVPASISCCKQCNIVWNRHVNAGKNIFQIGYHTLVENNQTYSIRRLLV